MRWSVQEWPFVGERAIAAVASGGDGQSTDHRWTLYRSQWGGSDRVIARVLSASPVGATPDGEPAATNGPEADAQDGGEDRLDVLGSLSWRRTATARGRLADALDYLETAVVYVLGPPVSVWQPLWLGFPLAETTPDPAVGVLVRTRSVPDVRTRRRWLRRAKQLVSPAVTSGALSPEIARWLVIATLPQSDLVVPATLQNGPF